MSNFCAVYYKFNVAHRTYQHLHSILSGHLESTTPDQIADHLKPRVSQLKNVSAPFGAPSDASKKKLESGSVTLRDGIVLRVEPADKECVLAISARLEIDEIEALVLLRSFLYNEGLPERAGASEDTSLVDELVEAITPFYYSERLFVLRTLIPLFRAKENADDPVYTIANDYLPQILTDGNAFAQTLLTEYKTKTKATLPERVSGDPRQAAAWARQNAKEQLVLLEVLFWTMWSYASCDGPQVVRIFETAYETNLGSAQQNSTLLLDDEGVQLQRDSAALWILLTIEVLELERAAEPGGLELSSSPADAKIYWSSPESLKRIHELVMSHTDSHYACTYMAWAFVLSRITQVALETRELSPSYNDFVKSLMPQPSRPYSKDQEHTHSLMARTCLDPDVGLFKLMYTLLTTSPIFVTAAAWKTASTLTDPNAVAYRSVFKG